MKTDFITRAVAYVCIFFLLSNDIAASAQFFANPPNFSSEEITHVGWVTEVANRSEPRRTSANPTHGQNQSRAQRSVSVEELNLANFMDFEILDDASVQAYKVEPTEMKPLPTGVINVTRRASAYRIAEASDSGYHVAMGVDPTRLTYISDLNQVQLFFYDHVDQDWKRTHILTVDQAKLRLEAMVPGETDYFAGLIQSPEMPEASAFVPTNISDIDPANPAAGIRMMQPPSANRQGSANISYPLWLPPGRQGVAPSLALSYSSDSKESWVGYGWNLSVSSIGIDTKWGVPDYSSSVESDPYILDGEELFMAGNFRPNRPNTNESNEIITQPRVTSSVRFFRRIENSYQIITRRGTTPSNYVWEVEDASGTKRFYGTTDGSTVSSNHVLRESQGQPIARWALAKVQDKWGNYMTYSYQKSVDNTTGLITSGGVSMYLSEINYTAHSSAASKYKVEFILGESTRVDGRVSMNYGFKVVDNRQLESIKVWFTTNLLVEYQLEYSASESSLFKTLLTDIVELKGNPHREFYRHELSYYPGEIGFSESPDEIISPREENTYLQEAPWYVWPTTGLMYQHMPSSAIGTTINDGNSRTIGLGAGAGGTSPTFVGVPPAVVGLEFDKASSFVLMGTSANTESRVFRDFRDMNGDGLCDVLFLSGDEVFYQPLYRLSEGALTLGNPRKVNGISHLTTSENSTLSLAIESVGPANSSSKGASFSHSTNVTNSQMIDMNSDGFVDYVARTASGDRVFFGEINDVTGEYNFAPTSQGTTNPIVQTEDLNLSNHNTSGKQFEVVKVWEAIAEGEVLVSGEAVMLEDGEIEVAIQKNSTYVTSFTSVDMSNPLVVSEYVSVVPGDRLIFRVAPKDDGQLDLVQWDPQVEYVEGVFIDGHGTNWGTTTFAESFTLSDKSVVSFDASRKFRMNFDLLNGELFSDDVLLKVELISVNSSSSNTAVYQHVIPHGTTTIGSLFTGSASSTYMPFQLSSGYYDPVNLTGVSAGDDIYLKFSIGSTSNNDWSEFDATALVEFEDDCDMLMEDVRLIPEFESYDLALSLPEVSSISSALNGTSNYHIQPDFGEIVGLESAIQSIFSDISTPSSEMVYMTVKSGNEIVERLGIRFDGDPSTLSNNGFELKKLNLLQYGSSPGEDYEDQLAGGSITVGAYNSGNMSNFLGSKLNHLDFKIEFHSKGTHAIQLLNFIRTNIQLFNVFNTSSGVVAEVSSEAGYYASTENDIQRHYLNWGVFGWSPKSGNEYLAIPSTSLESELGTLDVSGFDSFDFEAGNDPSAFDPNQFEFWPLHPISDYETDGLWDMQSTITKNDRYTLLGSHIAAFRQTGALTPGSPTEIEISADFLPNINISQDPEYHIYTQLNTVISNSLSVNTGSLLSGTNVNISDPYLFYSKSKSTTTDMDGDGYPDIVVDRNSLIGNSDLEIARSNVLGGLAQFSSMNADIRITKGTFLGASAQYTGTYGNSTGVRPTPGKGILQISDFTVGGTYSAGGSYTSSRQRELFMDFNGDGLSDVYEDADLSTAVYCRLNKGGDFESNTFTLANNFEQKSGELGISLSAGLVPIVGVAQYNAVTTSVSAISFGVNLNLNRSNQLEGYLDFNGDGLVDYVSLQGANDYLYLNTGTEFRSYDLSANGNEAFPTYVNESGSIGFSSQFRSTIALILSGTKSVFSGGAADNFSQNRVKSRLQDVNGDGSPDAVIAKDGTLEVYYGKCGKANLLKTVTNPLEGTFTIDYELVGNRRGYYRPIVETHRSAEDNERILWDMPSSKWVMSSLETFDGLELDNGTRDLDGEDVMRISFRYDGGIRIRRDRRFVGFTRIGTYSPDQQNHREDFCMDREDIELEQPRDVSHLYSSHPQESPAGLTVVIPSSIRRYNYSVVDYVKPASLGFEDMKMYSYEANIALHNYSLHVHEWKDEVEVLLTARQAFTGGEDSRIDVFELSHVELISDHGISYELRTVDVNTGKVVFDDLSADDWRTFDESLASLAKVPENFTVFQATTDKRNINYPVIEDRDNFTTQKFHIKYDEYTNVIWYEDFGTMLTASQNRVLVNTIVTGHWDNIEQFTTCTDFFANISAGVPGYKYVVAADQIHYYIEIPSSVVGYESAILTGTLEYDNGCVIVPPTGPLAHCQEGSGQGFILSTHSKWVTDITHVYKDVDLSTYDFRIIAKMFYESPQNAGNRTNALLRHEIYVDNDSPANLRRYSEVRAWNTGGVAPTEIANQLAATYEPTTDAVTNLTYDAYGNVVTITGPANHVGDKSTRTFSYDAPLKSLVTSVTNQWNEQTSFIYNIKMQLLIQTTDVNGHPTKYAYDDFYRMKEVWAPRELYDGESGPTIAFEYYPNGIDSQVTHGDLPAAITRHNTGNKDAVVTFTNAGNINTYRSSVFPTGSLSRVMPSSVSTATITDRLDQVMQIQTQSDYDAPGGDHASTTVLRVSGTAAKDPFNTVYQQRNDFISSSGVLGVFIENESEIVTTTSFDLMNRPVSSQSLWSDKTGSGDVATMVTSDYSYAWRSGLNIHSGLFFSSQVSIAGANTQTSYVDARGRTIATEVNGENILTEFNYNELGQLEQVIDPKSLITSYVYDNFGRVTEEDHPDRGVTNTEYDPVGNVTRTTWENQVTNFAYNYTRLEQKSIVDANSSLLYDVTYAYGAYTGSDGVNAVGRVIEVIQGSDSESPFLKDKFEYDELGQTHRTTRTIDVPSSGTAIYNTYSFYDSFGRVLRLKYPDNEQVDYEYSDVGSLTKITTQMPSQNVLDVITGITYDGYDNISYILYGNGTETEYRYHDYTRALMENSTDAWASSTSGQATMNERQFTYNDKGLITEVDFYVSPSAVGQNGGNGWSSFHHTYDQANRLSYSKMVFDGTDVYDVTMSYDERGAITRKNSRVLGMGPLMTNAQLDYNSKYTHDASERLTAVKNENTGTFNAFWNTFQYNDQGSITQRNHLDASGAPMANDVEQFVWNSDQQLALVRNQNTIQHYVYDYTGTRVLKSDYTSSGLSVDDNDISNTGSMDPYKIYVNEYFVESFETNFSQTTKHYYMGMQRVASDMSLQEVPSGGEELGGEEPGGGEVLKTSTTASLTNARSTSPALNDFVNRMGEIGLIDGQDFNSATMFEGNTLEALYPEYVRDFTSSNKGDYSDPANECCFTGDRYWYHPDYLGSVAMITNFEGVVHQMFFTNAWGERMHTHENSATGSFNSPYRFNGKELDEETGFAYYGARYYDSQISMWLSVDPLAHEYRSLSSYNFVANNPISLVDPDGKQIDPASQQEWNLHRANIEKRRDELIANSVQVFDLNGKNPRIVINDYEERIERLNNTLAGMDKMEDPNNSQVYKIDSRSCAQCVTYMNSNGEVVIPTNGGSTGMFTHEVSHGIQFENRELAFLLGSNGSISSFNNEVEAYRNQVAYGGYGEVSGINPGTPVVTQMSQIDMTFVQGIELGGNSVYKANLLAHIPINPNMRGSEINRAFPGWPQVANNISLRNYLGMSTGPKVIWKTN